MRIKYINRIGCMCQAYNTTVFACVYSVCLHKQLLTKSPSNICVVGASTLPLSFHQTKQVRDTKLFNLYSLPKVQFSCKFKRQDHKTLFLLLAHIKYKIYFPYLFRSILKVIFSVYNDSYF